MDVGVNAPCCYDHSLSCQGFCRCAYCHSRCYAVHNVRVSGFTDSCNLAVFDSNVSFDDSGGIHDQGIGDHKVKITVLAAGFTDCPMPSWMLLPPPNFYFVSVYCVIFFDLNHKACICQTYFLSPVVGPYIAAYLLPEIFVLIVVLLTEILFNFAVSMDAAFVSSVAWARVRSFKPNTLFLPPISVSWTSFSSPGSNLTDVPEGMSR